ncbi:MAG: ATP-grasp domain-containing protein [candidate division KSB1 bacterium]|nr:ATP-grasp domain-containing protein [candidate division KSB1 bacterium]MDZ7302427.1 ATP-grasp domain-containing protein [candidate division KSB1 bacterium]MDZ7311629.1 ATP-grasp domain-containing protein [candidate division KSB1 bacterium]
MRVGITYNVKHPQELSGDNGNVPVDDQAEWDDPETIQAIIAALSQYHEVIPIEADLEAYDKLRRWRPDIVFNIAEGKFGASRELQIPALLEMLKIPYTGSDPLTLGICLDKSRAKEILTYHHIATAKFSVVQSLPLDGHLEHLDYPLFVKPIFEGSSKGIWNDALVNNFAELTMCVQRIWRTYSQPALVEEYLPGREFTVSLLGNGPRLRVLPIVEISFDGLPDDLNKFYSYEVKWISDRRVNPAKLYGDPKALDSVLQTKIEELCKRAFYCLNCRDWCRIDIRLNAAGEPCIMELNPLPGLIPDPAYPDCFVKAGLEAGLSYDELVLAVLEEACLRLKLAPKATVALDYAGSEIRA